MTKSSRFFLIITLICMSLVGYLTIKLLETRVSLQSARHELQLTKARLAVFESSGLSKTSVIQGFDSLQQPSTSISTRPLQQQVTSSSEASGSNQIDNPNNWSAAKKKIVRAQILTHIKTVYSDFVKEHGLSPADAKNFYDLLLEQEMQNIGLGSVDASSNAGVQFSDDQTALKIGSALGGTLADAFKEYRETVPLRLEVEQLSSHLQISDTPLTEAQRMEIARAISRDRHDFGGPTLSAEQSADELIKAYSDWNQAREERMATILRSFLNPSQLENYNDFLELKRDNNSIK